ncbi:hypothetical protein PA7_31840 [Pseudonocardia asaccharolytica DSM 44247 = NBRC 16224]|uniref:HNH nuclease domain-containing protein n=1 Tax=Pseudonocardia asaccharolytica DSM 44247 = NBRC 16224 TaxID=1123024 RepID=A0A511D3V5_9PSEU|nr:hypothetical protein PA7_31840 [Pseudonocardia asaccharolytica DSM 44247 = NBRC 16224]
MSGQWEGRASGRNSAAWKRLRRFILDRDSHRCTWPTDHGPCGAPADQVDHIDRHGGDDPNNLRALCRPHHAIKTSAEGNAERWRHRERRPTRPHPGFLDQQGVGGAPHPATPP